MSRTKQEIERMHEKPWHAIAIEETLKTLGGDRERGLPENEVNLRLTLYGSNELHLLRRISPARILLKQFGNLMVAILVLATIVSAFVGEVIDAIVILIILVFVAMLGFVHEYKAERALEALKKIMSPTCTVIREGREKVIEVKGLVPGDIVVLKTGDKVPADLRLTEAFNLETNEAPLTGESTSVRKYLEVVAENVMIGDRTNMLYSGTTVTSGRGRAVVTATGMKTEIGKIAEKVTTITEEKTPLEMRMSEIAKKIGFLALGVIILIALVEVGGEISRHGSLSLTFLLTVLLFGVALAVAAVPEALPAIVTGSLAIGMHIMAKRNALVRRMPVVETLGATQIVCVDKTGTLTRGEMTVRKLYLGTKYFEVSGDGYDPTGNILIDGNPIAPHSEPGLEDLGKAVLLCNDAKLGREDGSWAVKGDPTEGALIVLSAKLGFESEEIGRLYPRISEVSFSPERKRMTTVHYAPDAHKIAFMKGAPETVLGLCSTFYLDGRLKEKNSMDRERMLHVNSEMASAGLRVLGVAKRVLSGDVHECSAEELESNFTFLGFVGMIDPPRPEAIESVKDCKNIGMKSIMITGDHKLTALTIAKEMGIYEEGDLVLTGEELERMQNEEFESVVEKVRVYARVSPLHKLKIVEAWKKRGKVVAMTGDGVNDAPALKRSDIGIAMGITGTDVAKEASDLVLADDNFATIVKAIELGRWVYANIKKYLTYLLQGNLVEIAVMSIGALLILRQLGYVGEDTLPLLPVHILYINLATDGLPALALGFSPPDPDIMKRAPRRKDEPVFTRDVKLFLILALIVETPVLTLAFISALPNGIESARTRLFLLFVFVELATAINCRSLSLTINKAKPHKWLILAVVWESLLIIILLNIPLAREALHIAYPTFEDIIWIVGGSLTTFPTIEGLKRFARLQEIELPNTKTHQEI